jgi:hypothetical protein
MGGLASGTTDPPVPALRQLEPTITHFRYAEDYIGPHVCGADLNCPQTVRASDGPGIFRVSFAGPFSQSAYQPWEEDILLWRLRTAALCKSGSAPVEPQPGATAFTIRLLEPQAGESLLHALH